MPDSPVQLAIAEWQNKQITGTELMRRLVSFDKWMLPMSEAAAAEMVSTGAASRLMYSQDGEGVSRLYLFSDGEAYNAFRASVGQDASEQHFLTTTGTWIFQLPLDPLDFIEIDPATPWQIGYHKEQFPRLRAMAGAVEVEQALAALRAGTAGPGSITKVRQYEHYILAVTSLDGGYTLALAPDDRDRTLAAIFTSDDSLPSLPPRRRSATFGWAAPARCVGRPTALRTTVPDVVRRCRLQLQRPRPPHRLRSVVSHRRPGGQIGRVNADARAVQVERDVLSARLRQPEHRGALGGAPDRERACSTSPILRSCLDTHLVYTVPDAWLMHRSSDYPTAQMN